jgi:hypothetical protein
MGSRGIEGRGRKTTVVIRFGAISSGFFVGGWDLTKYAMEAFLWKMSCYQEGSFRKVLLFWRHPILVVKLGLVGLSFRMKKKIEKNLIDFIKNIRWPAEFIIDPHLIKTQFLNINCF